MPIKIQSDLPAKAELEEENIFVMDENRAMSQDFRELQIVILNLMPIKQDTELQLLRALSNTPLQIDVTFLQMASHVSKNTSASHLKKFYVTFDEIKKKKFDGMIITGAPVEKMEFNEVNYWEELTTIMEWSKTHTTSTLHICWGAQAALYYNYGIPKHLLPEKVFGVFRHQPLDLYHPLLRGFSDVFYVPHSRHTENRKEDIIRVKDLQILSYSEEAGVHLVSDMACRNFYCSGHCEYDSDTLAREYFRDLKKGLDIKMPHNYFPDNDIKKTPVDTWRGAASLLFQNWLNYFVYQKTPYDIADIK